MSKTTGKPVETQVVEFELDGVTCTRWIDSDNMLHVSGPEGMEKQLADYAQEFARLSTRKGPVLFKDSIKPFDVESVPIKYRAIPDVLADEAEKALNGDIRESKITITAGQVKAKIKQRN
jgi:hypothetical protein